MMMMMMTYILWGWCVYYTIILLYNHLVVYTWSNFAVAFYYYYYYNFAVAIFFTLQGIYDINSVELGVGVQQLLSDTELRQGCAAGNDQARATAICVLPSPTACTFWPLATLLLLAFLPNHWRWGLHCGG